MCESGSIYGDHTGSVLDDHLQPLSESQKKAVLCDSRYVKVIAGAGAGKTETLTRKIVYLLLVEKVDPSSIVAFTFTKKAAQNMRTRIYRRIEQLCGVEACGCLGDMFIGTIHSFCLRILHENFGFGNYTELDEHHEMAFLMRVGRSCFESKRGNYADNCQKFLTSLNIIYSEMTDREKLSKEAGEFARSVEAYETEMDMHHLLSFNRMVDIAVKKIRERPELVSNIRHLIVDEYQDINRAQECLIEFVGRNGQIFAVGDPRQTIYQFRGSDEQCFDNFGDFNAEVIAIRENRRSVPEIIELANSIADNFHAGYESLIPVRKNHGSACMTAHCSDISEGEWIAKNIESIVNSGKCKYRDIAVLYRSVRNSAPVLIDALRSRNIPFIVGGNVGLFDRPEIKAVAMYMLWIPEFGYFQGKKDYEHYMGEQLVKSAEYYWNDAVGEAIIPDDYKKLLSAWQAKGRSGDYKNLVSLYYQLLDFLGYKKLNPKNPLHSVMMANLGRFSNLLNDFESANRFGGVKPDSKDLLKWLVEYINGYSKANYEERPADEIRAVDAVQIVTIHQSKGLEWPVVFIPAMSEYRFPHSKTGEQKEWLIPRVLFDAEKYEGTLSGERKLLYVAVTRARDYVFMGYFSSMNKKPRNPGKFVGEVLTSKTVRELSPENELSVSSIESSSEDEDIKTYSAGDLVLYKRCPHMYRLRSVWGYESGLAEMLGYGKALHHCLSESVSDINSGTPPVGAVARAVDEKFHMPYVGGEELDTIKEGAKKQLAAFAHNYEEDLRVIKNVETSLEYPTKFATITGRADVILADSNDSIEVRDYKTSDTVVTPDEAELQVQLYALALKNAGVKVTRGSVAYLQQGTVKMVDVDETALGKADSLALRYIDRINEEDFCASAGKACEICDFIQICPWKGGNGAFAFDLSKISKAIFKNKTLQDDKEIPDEFYFEKKGFGPDYYKAREDLRIALERKDSAMASKSLFIITPHLDEGIKEKANRIMEQIRLRESEGYDIPDLLVKSAMELL